MLVITEETKTETSVVNIEILRDSPELAVSKLGDRFNVYSSDRLLPVETEDGDEFRIVTLSDSSYWPVQLASDPTVFELVGLNEEFTIGGYEVYAILKCEGGFFCAYWIGFVPLEG